MPGTPKTVMCTHQMLVELILPYSSLHLYAYSEYPHTSQNLNRHRVPLYPFHTLEFKKKKTTAIKIKGFTVYSDK